MQILTLPRKATGRFGGGVGSFPSISGCHWTPDPLGRSRCWKRTSLKGDWLTIYGKMTRVDASLPEPLAALLDTAIAEGYFKGASDAARLAVREHFENDADARVDAVLALIEAQPPAERAGDDAVSLADVVRLTGRLPADLPDELTGHYDVPSNTPPESDQR